MIPSTSPESLFENVVALDSGSISRVGGSSTDRASTARGEAPKDRPYKVPHLLSTMYRAVGIDPSRTFPNGSGRPMYVLDERDVVTELV